MLSITIPRFELFDDSTGAIEEVKECELMLEHSLISISKWESKWKKPFLGKDPKTYDETADYIRCMTLNQKVDPRIYSGITVAASNKVNEYINDSMTATWFSNSDEKPNREIITSELIYYWMIASEIPFECQKWHLNRLLTLIRICSIKNKEASESAKKGHRPSKNLGASNASLNAARRKALGTKG